MSLPNYILNGGIFAKHLVYAFFAVLYIDTCNLYVIYVIINIATNLGGVILAYKLTSIWVDEDVKKRIMKLAIDNGVPFGKMLEILADNFKIQEEGKIDGQGFND